MNADKPAKNIHSNWLPWAVISVTTPAIIVISVACLSSGYFIIFQNLFYIPIIIACNYYTKRGFAFSVIVSGIYYCLIIAFTRDSAIILEAMVRVLIFLVIAGVVTYMALKREQAISRWLDTESWGNILDSINDIVWVLSPDGRIRQANKATQTLFSIGNEKILGQYCYKIVHGTDKPPPDCPLSRMLISKRRESLNVVLSGRTFRVTVDPIFDLSGYFTGAIHTIASVTDSERLDEEKALRKGAQYEAVINNLPGKVFIKDKELRYLSCNESYARDLKIKPEDITGKTDYDFFPVDMAEKYRKDDKEVMELGSVKNMEEDYILSASPTGTDNKISINTVKAPVKDENGNIIGVVGFFWDITERRKIEKEKERYEKWQVLVNLLRQSLLIPATLEDNLKNITDSIVTIFNVDFCRIWLVLPGDLCAKGCVHAQAGQGTHTCVNKNMCLHLMSSSGRYTHINGKIHSRVPLGCYKIGLIASGANRKFLTNDVVNEPRVHNHEWARELGLKSFAGYQVKASGGNTLGVMAVFAKHEISQIEDALLESIGTTIGFVVQRHNMEMELRRVEIARAAIEIKSKFVAIVSHELRSPLVAIREGINLVEEGAVGDISVKQKDLLDIAKRNADRLERLINNVLDFQKIRLGKMVFEMRENDINEVVLEVARDMSLAGKNSDIELEADTDSAIPKIVFDRDKIVQVVTNLLSNAIKATDKGSVIINTRMKDGMVCVDVKDTGCGIDGLDIERIFLPFESVSVPKDKKRGGSGLGLAICKEIVTAHNGNIWVESQLGKGTTFHFTLPVKDRGDGNGGKGSDR